MAIPRTNILGEWVSINNLNARLSGDGRERVLDRRILVEARRIDTQVHKVEFTNLVCHPLVTPTNNKNLERKRLCLKKGSSRKPDLTPKGLRVFLLKTASKQPLLKTSQIVQDWNQSWYFQP
jgi:hypothetical protein